MKIVVEQQSNTIIIFVCMERLLNDIYVNLSLLRVSLESGEPLEECFGRIENMQEMILDRENQSSQSNTNEEVEGPSRKLDSILLIDGDDRLLQSLKNSLADEFQLWCASDGLQGLECAQSKLPDIIITDISIPEVDGFEICHLIKANSATSHIPVIFLTAKNDKQSIIHGLEAGASDYMLKPADPAILKVRIRNILDERIRMRDIILKSGLKLPKNLQFSNSLDKDFVNKTLEVIETNLSNTEFQIADFCRELAMSRTAFYNKLKALTGLGPNDFVRMVRLNKAKELLESHLYNVGEVSDMVGFSDPKYFSICFKKQFDISPSKI